MAVTTFAVFYWTSSGVMVAKCLPDDDSQLVGITAPQGQTVIILPTVATPRGQGCQNDDQCRAAIGTHRGAAALAANADRGAMVDGVGAVTGVYHVDPANVTPAQLGFDPSYSFVFEATGTVEIGDTYSLGVFSRRWVIASSTTGVVASVVSVPLGQAAVAGVGQFAVPNLTAQIGSVVPIPPSVGVGVGGVGGV